MINRNNILATATAQIGYREGQNNDNKFGREIGCNNQPWCSMFVFWVLRQNGITTPGDWNPAKRLGYVGCPALYRDAVKHGWITTEPQPGDLVLFDWNGDHNADHIGIVLDSHQFGDISSIEGNTGDSNWSNGDGVYQRTRYAKHILCYISLDKMVGLPGENGEVEFDDKDDRVFKRGDSGEMVKKIQEALNKWSEKAINNLHYGETLRSNVHIPLDVDGDFGAKTDARVQWFQVAEILTIDGICGPETLKALGL